MRKTNNELSREKTNNVVSKQAVQSQMQARSLTFRIKQEEVYCLCSKSKALISFAVTVKLICVFLFAYADCWFSHAEAQMISLCLSCSLSRFSLLLPIMAKLHTE